MTNTASATTFLATRQVGQKYYELKDHLGNIRAVVTDKRTAAGDVEVASASNYYPFGMLQPGNSAFSKVYRFGFNGKEMDNDMGHGTGNMYDYGFRIYNARIGKFLSVDPLTNSYPWYTPYQFAGNGPIWAIDLDGLEELITIDGALWEAGITYVVTDEDVFMQVGLESLGKKQINQSNFAVTKLREQGFRMGSNGKLYRTTIVNRQMWIDGQLQWAKIGKNIGNKSFTTKGLVVSTLKTTFKEEIGVFLKELGGPIADMADMGLRYTSGGIPDPLNTDLAVQAFCNEVNESIEWLDEKNLTQAILLGSEYLNDYLSKHKMTDDRYAVKLIDKTIALKIIAGEIKTFTQLYDYIDTTGIDSSNEYSLLYRFEPNSEEINLRAIVPNNP